MEQPARTFHVVDHSRPFIEVIQEEARYFHPYPRQLVELFATIPREVFVPDELREVFRSPHFSSANRLDSLQGRFHALSTAGTLAQAAGWREMKYPPIRFSCWLALLQLQTDSHLLVTSLRRGVRGVQDFAEHAADKDVTTACFA